jgi:hypothetical protein
MDPNNTLAATLELQPGSGKSFGTVLNKRANRSFRSVSTRPASREGPRGSITTATAAAAAHTQGRSGVSSAYKSRFLPMRAGAAQAWASTVSRGQGLEGAGTQHSATRSFANDMEVVDFTTDIDAAPRMSEKERLRHEHEQSQMELMQFIAQISTVSAAAASGLRWAAELCAWISVLWLNSAVTGGIRQPVRVPETDAD